MIAALFKLDFANFQPIYENIGRGSHSGFFTGAIAIMITAPFFLAGFETIPQGVEDSKVKHSSVGKMVVLSVTCAILFYAGLLFAFGGAMPWKEFWADGGFGSPAAGLLLQHIYEGPLGQVFFVLLVVGALTGLITTWNGFMMASPRLLMGMARANMIPAIFAKQHPKYGTPIAGLIFCFILSFIGPFLGMGLIDPITGFAGAGFVLSWGITAFCVVRLRKTMPGVDRPYRVPGGSATAWFGGIVMAGFFVLFFIPGNPVFMGGNAVAIFCAWGVVGALLYLGTAPQRNKIPAEERAAALFSPRR
jgi:amino acid transporter